MKLHHVQASAVPAAGRFRQKPSLTQLLALSAMHINFETKKHARLILRNNGLCSNNDFVDSLIHSRNYILSCRRNPWQHRVERRLGKKVAPQRVSGRAPVRLPEGTPMSRLKLLRQFVVSKAAKSCLRNGAAGGSSMNVELTREPSAVGYSVQMSSNNTTYGGSFKGWTANEDHHHIKVPADWRIRVEDCGLATAGGLLTLTAQRMVARGEIELFQATWVEQGRGYSVTVRQGVIARLEGEVYHADSTELAIRGVKRKADIENGRARQGRCAKNYELSTLEFAHRFSRYGGLPVSIDDAYATGACAFGVNSWCASIGIEPQETSTTLAKVLDGFVQNPLIEVRRTVLHVVAKYRRRNRKTHGLA